MNSILFIQIIISVLFYIILAFSYLGVGWFCARIFRINIHTKNKFFILVWAGWAITLLLLQIINLLVPINVYTSIFLLLFGSINAIFFLKTELRDGTFPALPRIYWVLLTIAVIWIADQAMLAPAAYDSGLYHFNSIRWLNEFPIVLGLGNLHGRFAFNQSFFAYVAYLNLYPFFEHGYNIANSFLLLTVLAECLLPLSGYLDKKDRKADLSAINVAKLLFVPILIYLAATANLSSPTPDAASSILQILIFIYFIRAIEEKTSNPNNLSQILFILIISATAITVKLSNLIYVLAVCFTLLLIRLKSWYVSPKQILLLGVKLLALPALIIFIWSLRGMLLSGCPAYPLPLGCGHTAWSVPVGMVRNEAVWIYSWARLPGQTPDKIIHSWNWITPWFFRVVWGNISIILYPLILSIISGIVGFLLYNRQPLSQKINRNWFLVPMPILAGFIYWFFSAPDLRFAHALFWIIPVAALMVLLRILEASGKLRIGLILILFFLVNANITLIFVYHPQIITHISTEGFMPVPVVTLEEKTTLSGIRILTPAQGDQCWDSKIPCTPYFKAELNFMERTVFPEFTVSNAR